MPGNFRKGLLALVAGSLVMQTSVQAAGAGDYANPSQQYGGSQNRYGYYGNTAQPGGGYGNPYGGAPGSGYIQPGYTAPGQGKAATTRPAPVAGTAAKGGDDSTAAEIAQLKQRVSELEAAIERINSRLQAEASAGGQSAPPDYPAREGASGYPGTAPGSTAFSGAGVPPASTARPGGGEAGVPQGAAYGYPATGTGQRQPTGNTGNTGSVPRGTGTYVQPPQDTGPRVYEFNK